MSEEKQPTREEILEFLKESIELSDLRAQLQELNTKIAVQRAEELKALVFIAQITNPKAEELSKHILTQEDLDGNPDILEAGFKAGDEITIPEQMKRKLKKETK
jgi:hypothetical protein